MPAAVATTQETYRRDLDEYVLPRFGAYRLGQLPADEIENWLNDEIAAAIAPSSVHRHYRTLRRMLQVAVEKQKILTNPCDRVDPPRFAKREMTFPDWDQVIRLAEAHSERYRALIYVAVDTGMRWSELVGLRRGKVDLKNRKVRVTEQLVQLEDRSFLRKEPKTAAGVRSISISPFTASLLAAHLESFAQRVRMPWCSPTPQEIRCRRRARTTSRFDRSAPAARTRASPSSTEMISSRPREFGTRCSPTRDRRGVATPRSSDRRGRSRREVAGGPWRSCRHAWFVGR